MRETIERTFLPTALAIGVDYGDFWNLNPRLLKAFVEADRVKKRQIELEMYVSGRYVFDAVSLALANAFRKKGAQALNWLEEPYRLIPLTEEELEAQAEAERKKAIAFFTAMIPPKGGETDGRPEYDQS